MTPSDKRGAEKLDANSTKVAMQDQAVHWLLRQREGDMDADEWEEFTLWLEADPNHGLAYDAMVQVDESLTPMAKDQEAKDRVTSDATAEDATARDARVTQLQPASHEAPDQPALDQPVPDQPRAANDNPYSRYVQWAMASAAALLLAVFIWPSSNPVNTIVTQPGEMQTIALTDEITMTINGDSKVDVTEGEPIVSVARGEVAFDITADEPSPLRVNVGGLVLTDYGTIFNVSLDEGDVRIAVAEGIVAINPDVENIQIPAGELVTMAAGTNRMLRRDIDSDVVATWRKGRLEFDDTPVSDAMVQLQRSKGMNIKVSPGLADVRLTGSVLVSQSEADVAQSFAGYLGANARRDGDGWIIE